MAPTPRISVRLPATLCSTCGAPTEFPVEAATVRQALAEIERSQPEAYRGICDETGAVRRHLNLFVNSTHVREGKGLDTPLASGDVLTILAAVSGGGSWPSV